MEATRPFTFLLERVVVVPVHVLACVLIVMAVSSGRQSLFWWSFALKSAIDAVPTDGEIPVLLLEGIYVAFGIACLAALMKLKTSLHAQASS